MTDSKTVLIVDDESDIRMIINGVLNSRNFNMIHAQDGKEALEIMAEGKKIDLVFLDVMMPAMDGFAVLNEMHEKGYNKNSFVIMLTPLNSYPNIMKGYNVGADYYITKPFQNETLLNIVDYLIGDLTPEEKQNIELLL